MAEAESRQEPWQKLRAQYTWQDLQDAAVTAGTLWVVDPDGNWTREHHEVSEIGEDTFEERLSRLKFTVTRHRTRRIEGKDTWVACEWHRFGRWNMEYLVNVYTDELNMERVLAVNLPAYLQLRRQLREAGMG